MDTGVLPVGRFPVRLQRSNRGCGSQRLLLFIIDLENQSNASSNEHAELKNSFPCNIHTCHPLSFTIRGKRSITPRKKSRGTAYRGAAGSTRNSISHHSTDCKEKSGAYRCNAMIRPARESVRQTEIYLSPDFRIISFRIIPKSNTTAANTPQVNIPVYQGADCIAYNPGCVL